MAMAAYKGIVKRNRIVLEGGVELPDGTEVVVTPVKVAKGTPPAILAALNASPPLEPGDAEELLRLIEEGKRPVRYDNPLARKRKRR